MGLSLSPLAELRMCGGSKEAAFDQLLAEEDAPLLQCVVQPRGGPKKLACFLLFAGERLEGPHLEQFILESGSDKCWEIARGRGTTLLGRGLATDASIYELPS